MGWHNGLMFKCIGEWAAGHHREKRILWNFKKNHFEFQSKNHNLKFQASSFKRKWLKFSFCKILFELTSLEIQQSNLKPEYGNLNYDTWECTTQ